MRIGRAEFVFLICAVNVNVALKSIDVPAAIFAKFFSRDSQNARGNKIAIGFVFEPFAKMRSRGFSRDENRSRGNVFADFFNDGEKSVGRAERIFDAGRLCARCGNFVFCDGNAIAQEREFLVRDTGDERVVRYGNAQIFAFAFELQK